jgi:hypothetical protein
MKLRFIFAGLMLAGIVFSCAAVFAQQGGGRGGRGGGQQGNQGLTSAELAARGGQSRVPCVNEWQLPNGCDPARVTPKQLNPRDLSGVWTRTKGGANMNEKVVLTPEGQKRQALNKPSYGPRAVIPALGNDPMGNCDPLGLTRNLFLEVGGRSMEIAHVPPDRIMMFFEWAHQFRTIWMDGRQLPKDPPPRWMGYSTGRWEGDTLVVTTVGLDERTWLDMWGQPHSDQAQVEERYRRISPTNMEYSLTITDPVVFAKPFVSDTKVLSLGVEKSEDEKLETFCVPSEEQQFNRTIRDPAGGVTSRP